MAIDHTSTTSTASRTPIPQSMAHTFVQPQSTIIGACGGNCSHEARDHAIALGKEMNGYAQSLAAMARNAIPAGVAAATFAALGSAALGSMDPASGGVFAGAVAMGGAISSIGGNKGSRSV